MKTEIRSNAALALQEAVDELERLTSKPQMSRSEEKRYAYLLSKVSLLKNGFSPTEVAKVEAERLARAAGVVDISTVRSDDASEKEWRDALRGKGRFCPQAMLSTTHELNLAELRAAQAAGTQTIDYTMGAEGGYFVTQGFHDAQLSSMKQYDEIFDDENCNPIETTTGVPTTVPAVDDVSAASVLVAENSTPAANPAATVKAYASQLQAYSFRSGIVLVSIELEQDSGVPLAGLMARAFGSRHARGVAPYFITGTGSGQPLGIITAAQAANVSPVPCAGSAANDGSSSTGANSIGSPDIANLYHALNRAYRKNAVFAMNDDTMNALAKVLDKYGRPLIDLQADVPKLYGKRVIVCPSMDDIGPSKYPIVFYNPNYFLQRRVVSGSFVMRRFPQRYVEAGQVGFDAWWRGDSALSIPNALYPPVAILQMAS